MVTMTRVALADPGAALAGGRRRLAGVDAARGLALIGMMSVHLFRMPYGPDAPLARELVSGRSAALFAVLAGVGIALATGGTQPVVGAPALLGGGARSRPGPRLWPRSA